MQNSCRDAAIAGNSPHAMRSFFKLQFAILQTKVYTCHLGLDHGTECMKSSLMREMEEKEALKDRANMHDNGR